MILIPMRAAVLALVGIAVPAAAAAQAVPAACRPVLEAQRKTITMPHHLYSINGAADRGVKARADEMISVGGVNYLLYEGKWRRSPITPKAQLDRIQENVSNAKAFICRYAGAESMGGTAADVYTSHDEHDGSVSDSRIWVGKGSGLILRIEQDIDNGGGTKHHMSLRYEYANVRAPADVS